MILSQGMHGHRLLHCPLEPTFLTSDKEAKDKENADKVKAEKDAKDKEAAIKLADAQKAEAAALVKAKEDIGKLFDLPKVETAIAKLPADKQPTVKLKLDDFKKMWGDFTKEDNGAKKGEWKDKLKKAYDELKKAAGL